MTKKKSLGSNSYLSGEELIGNNYNLNQIMSWYKDEKEAYSELALIDNSNYYYKYHAQNNYLGYRHIRQNKFNNALSFGGAFAHETLPIINNINNLYVVEPSLKLRSKSINGKSINYIEPDPTGDLRFKSNYFDLITCFGVLHHIPNVEHIINEFFRVLNTGGFCLIREPIVSMGDWASPRKNLTKHERGIPYNIFNSMIKNANFEIIKVNLCFTKPFDSIWYHLTKKAPYNSRTFVRFDTFLAKVFFWNYRYHATSMLYKFRPTGVFYVLRKK